MGSPQASFPFPIHVRSINEVMGENAHNQAQAERERRPAVCHASPEIDSWRRSVEEAEGLLHRVRVHNWFGDRWLVT